MKGDNSPLLSRATPTDIAEIAPLFDSYRMFFASHAELDVSRRFLEDRMANGDSVLFFAREDGNAVGFIHLYPLWSSWYCRRIWFLSDLYVSEASRKHGVGRLLVERVIAHAKETDAASIMVELPRREPHLTEFYRKLGFNRDDVFELARYRLL